MNKLDKDYQNLLKDILENGVEKETRNGKVLSVFGRQIRHNMKDGFPLLTTKRMPLKTIVTELLFFLRGDTNIKYLVDNNCHIWDGDCFANYQKQMDKIIMNNIQYKKGFDTKVLDERTDSFWPYEEFINKIKTDDEFAKKWGGLGPIYGFQWRNWGSKKEYGQGESTMYGGIDQIQNLINNLKTNPDSRRMIVSAWAVHDLQKMVLPPCHFSFQVYTRELSLERRYNIWFNKNYETGMERLFDPNNLPDFDDPYYEPTPKRAISLMFNMRSNDVPLGLPFNIASYGLLLEIFGKMVNMVPDELIVNLGDTHIYLNQIDGVKEQLTREPFELPKLNINTEFWPTESGECGVGPLDVVGALNSFSDDNFCKNLLENDIELSNYKFHPTIKFPLSN